MIAAAISTTYREADVVDLWIRHMLAEDIDLLLIADKLADDGTRDILDDWHKRDERVEWVDDIEDCHRQAHWTNMLAAQAHDRGAEWILPCDVDEFPYASGEGTIAEALSECPYEKLYMRVWPHRDWNNKFDPHRLPKVCYRYSPDAQVVMGSHDVSLPGGTYCILDMRELQYRSFEHFCRKASDRNQTLEPAARARGDGAHHLFLEKMNIEELRNQWEIMQARPVTYDPIPTHASF